MAPQEREDGLEVSGLNRLPHSIQYFKTGTCPAGTGSPGKIKGNQRSSLEPRSVGLNYKSLAQLFYSGH